MALNNLPKVGQSVVGKDGIATQPWYAWFGRIQSALNAGTLASDAISAAITAIATALGSPDGTVANIPPLAFLRSTTYVHEGDAIEVSGTLSGGGVDIGISDDGVTNAKLANMAAGKIKARKTGSTGDPEDCTLSEVLDFVGSAANGDILMRASGAWTRLGAGTNGHVLTLASGLPSWAAGAGGGGAMVLLGTATVAGSAATVLTVTPSAALSAYKAFIVELSIKNATGTAAVTVSLFYNGDTTATNYNNEVIAGAPSVVAGRANNAVVTSLDASACTAGFVNIVRDIDGRPRAAAFTTRGTTSISSEWYGHVRNNTADVTSITLSASVASALAIGTTISVFGVV